MPRCKFPKHVSLLAGITLLWVIFLLWALPSLYHHFFVILAHRRFFQLKKVTCLRIWLSLYVQTLIIQTLSVQTLSIQTIEGFTLNMADLFFGQKLLFDVCRNIAWNLGCFGFYLELLLVLKKWQAVVF